MEPSKDITLIIHGPLSIYTVFSLYRYKPSFPIIVVTPRPKDLTENNIVKEVQNLMELPGGRISLLMYDILPNETIDNTQNRYYHFYSVHLALQAVTTKFAIKIRSDEFYSDMSPILDALKNYPSRLITTDVFFRNARNPMHPSDHVVAGSTEFMLDTFRTAKLLCEGAELPNRAALTKYILDNSHRPPAGKDKTWLAAEQILGMGVVLSQLPANKFKDLDGVQLMKEFFYIVPTCKLGLFRVMFNSAKDGPLEYFNDTFFDEEADVNNIDAYI
jgi:hypothetical protein